METSPSVRAPHRWFLWWFSGYAARRLRRDFHRVRILGDGPAPLPSTVPLVIYANHASWWDPMVALAVRPRILPDREGYAPIDAEMLERYGIFKHLGFFGVERDSPRGAISFLRQAEEVLRRPGAVLFVTPQGRFADVRERPLRLQRGIAHLAARVPDAVFVPFATEIVFWEESKPESLIHFGSPLRFAPGISREDVLIQLEDALEAAMDRLAAASVERRDDAFRDLLTGSAGVGGIYDAWRTLRARLTGRKINLHHGDR